MGGSKVNAIKPGTDIVRELNVKKLRELAGRDLSQAKYPLYVYFDEPRFQMNNLAHLDSIANDAVKELSLNKCRLQKLEGIDCFVKLKRLWCANNSIKKVDIHFQNLDLLDLSGNGLFEVPDLAGCPNLKELDLSRNKCRGVWSGILTCTQLTKLNLSKNKYKWSMSDEGKEMVGASLAICQNWSRMKEINLAGNKVGKFEGYRFYLSTYCRGLSILDGVETSGDNNPANKPPNQVKVKPLADVLRVFEMKKKLMANPELMEKAAAMAAEMKAAEEGDEEGDDEGLVEAAAEEKEEEDEPGTVRVIISDLTAQLTKCFEGPKIAQAIMARVLMLVERLLACPSDDRIMFTKAVHPAEALEDFIQTLVVILERDSALGEVCLRLLTKMLRIVNEGVGVRCLVQLKDLLRSSTAMGELGGPLLVELVFPCIKNSLTPVDERELLLSALFEIEDSEVTKNITQILKPLIDFLKDAEVPSEALLGMFVISLSHTAAADTNSLAQIFRKEKITKQIIDLIQLYKAKIGRETADDKRMYSQVLAIIGGLARIDTELAWGFVRTGVHLSLLDQMSAKLQDSAALMYEETWTEIGEIVSAISGLCKDQTALSQAVDKGFLNQLTVCLGQDDLPPQVIATAYTSLLQVLNSAVPDTLESQIPETAKKPAQRKEAYELLVHEHGIEVSPFFDELKAESFTKEQWMITRMQINEVLEGIVPLLAYLGGSRYERLSRKLLGDVVPLHRLTNKPLLDVINSVTDLLSFYGERAMEIEVIIPEDIPEDADSDFEPMPEDLLQVKSFTIDANAFEICTTLDKAGRDGILFDLLKVPDDGIRLSAVTTLSHNPLSNFDATEIGKLVKMVADIEDVTAGRNEEIIAMLLTIMARLAESSSRQGTTFRHLYSRSVFVVLDILAAATASDARSSEQDALAKEMLCTACVVFLEAASKWKEAPALMRTREAIESMKMILMNEDRFGDEGRPARVEATGVGGNVQSLLKVLADQGKTGTVAARILNRVSELMEGPFVAQSYAIEVEKRLPPCSWKKVTLSACEDTPSIKQKRFEQQKLFFDIDGFKGILALLIDERKRIRRLEPKDLVKMGLEEADRLKQAAEDAFRGEDSEEELEDEEEDEEEEEEEEEEEDIGDDEGMDDEENMSKYMTQPWQICGQELGEEAKIPRPVRTIPTARTQAAGLRIFLSLLRYGEAEKKVAVRGKLRELRVFQNLAHMGMQCGFFPFNIGAKIFFLFIELLRLPYDAFQEEKESILLYEVCMTFITEALKKLHTRLLKGITVTAREESLMLTLTRAYVLMVHQLGWVSFSEDIAVDTVCDKLVGELLFKIEGVDTMLLWLYYERSLRATGWGWDKGSLERRNEISSNICTILAAFLRNSPSYQFEILIHINRLAIQFGLDLENSMINELMKQAADLAFAPAIALYLRDQGYSAGGDDEPQDRTLLFCWLTSSAIPVPSANPWAEPPEPPRKLLVATNQAVYILRENFREPCSICTPDRFCPAGPMLEARIEYESLTTIIRGYGGNAFRLVWESGMFSMEEHIDLASNQIDVIDDVIDVIAGCCDAVGQDVELQEDGVTWMELMRQINPAPFDATLLDTMDRVLVYDYCHYREIKAGKHPDDDDWRHASICLTGSSTKPLPDERPHSFSPDSKTPMELKNFYLFHEDLRFWQDADDPHRRFTKLLEWAATPDTKMDFLEMESAIIEVHYKEQKFQIKFGVVGNRRQYRCALNWFVEGGTAAFKPAAESEEAEDGKKKKKK